MWQYEKKLEYPVHIKNPDPRMAKLIITQYGGPQGKSLRQNNKYKISARRCFLYKNLAFIA